MKTANIKIITTNEPTALERILSITRHRKYIVTQLDYKQTPQLCTIVLEITTDRKVEQLLIRISALVDVISVELNEE